ncbi:MAG: TIGR04211 family SH3 domain-containing protein, partial [Vibrionaceae bacterium]
MKRAFFAFAVTLSLAAPSLCAQESYISDELFIYMHAGPGTEYRILGSINAGVPVKVMGAEKSGY